jgi:hypothetical protein
MVPFVIVHLLMFLTMPWPDGPPALDGRTTLRDKSALPTPSVFSRGDSRDSR